MWYIFTRLYIHNIIIHTGNVITPSRTQATSATATVQSTNNNMAENIDAIFSIRSNDCVDPTVTVTFEEIDFSWSSTEYFNVLDNDGNTITQCTGDRDQNCGVWDTCLNAHSLGNDIYHEFKQLIV